MTGRRLTRVRQIALISLLSVIWLLVGIAGGIAEAAPAGVMTDPPFPVQTTEAVNVRAGPSTTSTIINVLPAGTRITVVDEIPGEQVLADNVVWFRTSTGGYVYSGYTAADNGISNATATGRWIEIDRTQQIARAYENGRVVYTAPMVVGIPAFPTPVGSFTVLRRVLDETMDSRTIGIPLSSPLGYYVPHVLYTQYITNTGVALHDNYWSPADAFGNYPTSHGCIGLRRADAIFFWNFATIGTPVIIHD